MLFVFDVNKELVLSLTPTLLVIKILPPKKLKCEKHLEPNEVSPTTLCKGEPIDRAWIMLPHHDPNCSLLPFQMPYKNRLKL